MDFLQMKQNFFEVLKASSVDTTNYVETDEKDKKKENIKINIFEKSLEFNNYVTDVLQINTNESISIEDLKKLEVKDGKLIDNEEKENPKAEDTENAKKENKDTDNDKEKFSIKKFINSLLGEKEIFNLVDTDKNEELSKEEIHAFIDKLNVIDARNEEADAKDLTIKEIFDGLIKIATNEFTMEEEQETNSLNEAYVNEDVMVENGNGYTPQYTNYGNYNVSNYANNTGNQITKKKDITTMSEKDLKLEYEKVETTIKEKEAELESIEKGENTEIKTLKENADKAQKTYQDKLKEIDKSNSTKLKQLEQQKENAQNTYDKNEKELYNAKNTLSEVENNVTIAKNTLDSYKTQLTYLDDSPDLAEKKAELEKLIVQKEANLKTAENELEKAKKAKETAEKNLENAKNALNKANEAKEKHITEMKTKHPDLVTLAEAYETAQKNYETSKTDTINKIKEEIEFSKNKLAQVKVEMQKRKDMEDLGKYSIVHYTEADLAKLQANHKFKVEIINGHPVLRYGWGRYNKVQPELNTNLQKFEEELFKRGYIVIRSDGERTFKESAIGQANKGNVVCSPGNSPHNYGAGADLTVFDRKTGRELTFDQIPDIEVISEQCNLKWGGTFKGKRKYVERHHFELKNWRKLYKSSENICN